MNNYKFSIINFNKNEDGFIAMISAIIISFVLLTITVVFNFVAFYGRFNVLDSEFKETSVALAEACADTAILEIAKGNTLTGEVTVGAGKCTIVSVTPGAGLQKIIVLKGIYKDSHTNLRVAVTPGSTGVAINSWEETP